MKSRLTRQLSQKLAQAHRSMSYRRVAKAYGITTPAGRPNGGMVKRLIDGYQPKRTDTLLRCGLIPQPVEPIIPDEPTRRVITGAWKLGTRWVSPEEIFGARA